MNPIYGTDVFGANVVDCNCRCHRHLSQLNQGAAPSSIEEKSDTRYEELKLAFKVIHDEYTASDSFKQWVAAKKAWEETETFKKEPNRYTGSNKTYPDFSWRLFYQDKPQPDIIEHYSYEESDYNLYKEFCYLSNFLNRGSWDGNFNIKCPGLSKPQEKFNLKRKLLLLEYGLPSYTKLPSEWYWGGYEWDWS